jgi:hypothetical protein
MAKRSLDQLIGLVGGFIGIIMGAIGMGLHRLVASISMGASETMLLFSVIGLVGALLVTSRKKDASMIMIVIGLAGIIAFPAFVGGVMVYVTIIPFIILLIAGVISRL